MRTANRTASHRSHNCVSYGSKAKRKGASLLEVVLSTSIVAAMTLTLGSTMQVSLQTLRLHEKMSGNAATNTLDWLANQVQGADSVAIIGPQTIQLTQRKLTLTIVDRIYLSGTSLMRDRGGVVEELASPVSQVQFRDPTGRGLEMEMTVAVPGVQGYLESLSAVRTVALDWVR